MGKVEHIITNLNEIEVKVLDIYQYPIINQYNKLINIPRIREYVYFLARDKGFTTGIKEHDGQFFLSLKGVADQSEYQDLLISMVKRMLQGYHEKRVITLTAYGQAWNVLGTFDCTTISKQERGIMTKILKQENRRLRTLGIKTKRQKKRYLKRIFWSAFPKLLGVIHEE